MIVSVCSIVLPLSAWLQGRFAANMDTFENCYVFICLISHQIVPIFRTKLLLWPMNQLIVLVDFV